MMWRALSRMIGVRLLLLLTIAAAGPGGVASSWHSLESVEHRLAAPSSALTPAVLADGALPPGGVVHCAACEFGATLRSWTPPVLTAFSLSLHDVPLGGTPSALPLLDSAADPHAGRAPPRLA
jgi:hypothetical protein